MTEQLRTLKNLKYLYIPPEQEDDGIWIKKEVVYMN